MNSMYIILNCQLGLPSWLPAGEDNGFMLADNGSDHFCAYKNTTLAWRYCRSLCGASLAGRHKQADVAGPQAQLLGSGVLLSEAAICKKAQHLSGKVPQKGKINQETQAGQGGDPHRPVQAFQPSLISRQHTGIKAGLPVPPVGFGSIASLLSPAGSAGT